jgi:hypothetical protein
MQQPNTFITQIANQFGLDNPMVFEQIHSFLLRRISSRSEIAGRVGVLSQYETHPPMRELFFPSRASSRSLIPEEGKRSGLQTPDYTLQLIRIASV